jgi:hypothetical protein
VNVLIEMLEPSLGFIYNSHPGAMRVFLVFPEKEMHGPKAMLLMVVAGSGGYAIPGPFKTMNR